MLIMLVIFIPHSEIKDGGSEWSQSQNVAYDTIARNTYSLGVAWIIFACHVGYGGENVLCYSQHVASMTFVGRCHRFSAVLQVLVAVVEAGVSGTVHPLNDHLRFGLRTHDSSVHHCVPPGR